MHQLRRARADDVFDIRGFVFADQARHVAVVGGQDRAAADAADQPLLLQGGQIAPQRGFADIQGLGQGVNGHRLPVLEHLHDTVQPFNAQHARRLPYTYYAIII